MPVRCNGRKHCLSHRHSFQMWCHPTSPIASRPRGLFAPNLTNICPALVFLSYVVLPTAHVPLSVAHHHMCLVYLRVICTIRVVIPTFPASLSTSHHPDLARRRLPYPHSHLALTHPPDLLVVPAALVLTSWTLPFFYASSPFPFVPSFSTHTRHPNLTRHHPDASNINLMLLEGPPVNSYVGWLWNKVRDFFEAQKKQCVRVDLYDMWIDGVLQIFGWFVRQICCVRK
jgi:hypothetical protein